jgi:hypothetical protein
MSSGSIREGKTIGKRTAVLAILSVPMFPATGQTSSKRVLLAAAAFATRARDSI